MARSRLFFWAELERLERVNFDLICLRRVGKLVFCAAAFWLGPEAALAQVDAAGGLRGKVMCGYQGWFRCPGDPAEMGWVHWSRDSQRIAPETLTFEMWPEMSEYPAAERYPAAGFTNPDGSPAVLFSSDNAATVQRHFEWMRDYEIDGAWLQQFVLELPGGPAAKRYPTRRRVLEHVAAAAAKSGRVWAITYDISGMPKERVYEVLTGEWKRMIDEKALGPRYLREGGKPVVQLFGFYATGPNALPADIARQVIEFFKTPGPYAVHLMGAGDWNWRRLTDPEWLAQVRRLDGYSPWNVGNLSIDAAGVKRSATGFWTEEKRDWQSRGALWMPVVYPGFSWDNLKRMPPGTSDIPRRKGQFLWEQFVAAKKLGAESAFVAMFDEVDEATAIFKVTNAPPREARFLGYEGLPSDFYLRLVREGRRMLRGERPLTEEVPLTE